MDYSVLPVSKTPNIQARPRQALSDANQPSTRVLPVFQDLPLHLGPLWPCSWEWVCIQLVFLHRLPLWYFISFWICCRGTFIWIPGVWPSCEVEPEKWLKHEIYKEGEYFHISLADFFFPGKAKNLSCIFFLSIYTSVSVWNPKKYSHAVDCAAV